MPCRSEYCEPSEREKELSRVVPLLAEIKLGLVPDPKYFGTGYDGKCGFGPSPPDLDVATKELCASLQTVDVSKYSLEMQVWWRNHQAWDVRRKRKEAKEAQEEKDKLIALQKLTPHERELLRVRMK